MAKILVAYFSRSGNTAEMAKLVGEGAREVVEKVTVKSVADTTPDDLVEYDGIIMGSPTYYGTMAAQLKQLLDDSVRHHGELVGKVGGAFSSSGGPGGGNETTVMDILKCLLIHGMIIPGNAQGDHYGPISVGAPDERSVEQCLAMGRIVGNLTKRLFS